MSITTAAASAKAARCGRGYYNVCQNKGQLHPSLNGVKVCSACAKSEKEVSMLLKIVIQAYPDLTKEDLEGFGDFTKVSSKIPTNWKELNKYIETRGKLP